MGGTITTVGFDADDTLWHNERFFRLTQERFIELLADHADPVHLSERLEAAERRNLGHYGFGIKGFVLSMIETALDVTGNRVPGHVIRELVSAGQEMLSHPIELLPHAAEAVEALRGTHTILLITKGDLLDQERKLAQSGLGELFHGVEIVSHKTEAAYRAIFGARGGPDAAVMVGNSMASDVLPPIAAGAHGVHVPHELTWALERADAPEGHPRFHRLDDLSGLPGLIKTLEEPAI